MNSLLTSNSSSYSLNKQKERFFSEVGMLLSAGVDLQTILKLFVADNKTKNKLNEIYEKILLQIIPIGIYLCSNYNPGDQGRTNKSIYYRKNSAYF